MGVKVPGRIEAYQYKTATFKEHVKRQGQSES